MGNTGSTNLSTLTTLTEDNKRWCVYGIAINHVLVPSIRPILEQEILKEYNDLQLNHGIDVQISHRLPVSKYPKRNMKYENINGNDTKSRIPFDYKITSHVDFAKLFLHNYMAKFNAFNETCDASAVLLLLGRTPVFHAALQTAANTVREGRNAWGHCNITEWNEASFTKRFDEMKQLVTGVGLSSADESKILADLKDWEDKGVRLCMNTGVDSELVKVVQEHVRKLSSDVATMSFESQEQINNVKEMLTNIQLDFEKRVQQLEQKQGILQREQGILQHEQDMLKKRQNNVEQRVTCWKQEAQDNCRSYDVDLLEKCDFRRNVEVYNESFHPGTRDWLSKKVDLWFEQRDFNSQVMILTADAGFGKSTFAGQVCKEYKERDQLKACHFFKSTISAYSDPRKMLESLASQLCENVSGFKEKLAALLQRKPLLTTIGDAFRVYLKDPLNSLPDQKSSILIVIDGLDESVSEEKKHLLDVIDEEFQLLPQWVKIFITSRPELVTKEKLERLNHVEILRDDEGNKDDLKSYLVSCLSGKYTVDENVMAEMVKMCEGSFLYAYYYRLELRKLNNVRHVLSVVPKGIHSIYQKYFKRLEDELKKVSIDIEFDKILEILVAMRNPFPLSLIANILKLPESTRTMKEVINKVNECLSALLPVYDDCITVFHKTVVDWLEADGKYGKHSFSVSLRGAHKTLWQACRQIFEQLNGLEKVEKQAKKYALVYGEDHLRYIMELKLDVSYFEYPSVGVIELMKGKIFGYGWLVFKDNETIYVMTTNNVLRGINYDQIDNALEVRVSRDESKYDATVTKNDFVVVTSDDDSALDYAVLKLKTSRIVQELPLNVSKTSPEPGGMVFAPRDEGDVITKAWRCQVQPYPEDLVDWLKSSGSSSFVPGTSFWEVKISKDIRSSSSLKIPAPSCEPGINFDGAEDLKQILIPIPHLFFSNLGMPVFNDGGQVVGMRSSGVFVSPIRMDTRFISFAVSMPRIIDDIRRKKPSEAKKWFPSYFD